MRGALCKVASTEERRGQQKCPLYMNDTTCPLKQAQSPTRLGLYRCPGRARLDLSCGLSGGAVGTIGLWLLFLKPTSSFVLESQQQRQIGRPSGPRDEGMPGASFQGWGEAAYLHRGGMNQDSLRSRSLIPAPRQAHHMALFPLCTRHRTIPVLLMRPQHPFSLGPQGAKPSGSQCVSAWIHHQVCSSH